MDDIVNMNKMITIMKGIMLWKITRYVVHLYQDLRLEVSGFVLVLNQDSRNKSLHQKISEKIKIIQINFFRYAHLCTI